MNNQFSENMSRIMAFSKEEACRLRCKSIKSEHLLLGLLRDTDGHATSILNSMSVDLVKLKEEIETLFPLSDEENQGIDSNIIIKSKRFFNTCELSEKSSFDCPENITIKNADTSNLGLAFVILLQRRSAFNQNGIL